MSILYTLKRLCRGVLGCSCAVVLAACANLPASGSHPGADAAQPLQRVIVPADTQRRDLLTHLLAGEFALEQSDLDAATREYAAAAALSDDPAVTAQAAHIAIAGKRWDAAHDALARWQALAPEDNDLRQAQAMLDLHAGDAEAAYANLARLLQQPDGAGWRAAAQALLSAEDKAQAGAMAERLLAAEPGRRGASSRNSIKTELLGAKAETWIAVSQMAMRLDRKTLAQTLADQSVARFASPEAYAWAAQLKLGAGDKDGARRLFADALRKNPHDAKTPRLRVAYAGMLSDLGDNISAARVLAEGPQNDYSYAARAAYLARSDDKVVKPLVESLYAEVKALPEPRPAHARIYSGNCASCFERKPEALKWKCAGRWRRRPLVRRPDAHGNPVQR